MVAAKLVDKKLQIGHLGPGCRTGLALWATEWPPGVRPGSARTSPQPVAEVHRSGGGHPGGGLGRTWRWDAIGPIPIPTILWNDLDPYRPRMVGLPIKIDCRLLLNIILQDDLQQWCQPLSAPLGARLKRDVATLVFRKDVFSNIAQVFSWYSSMGGHPAICMVSSINESFQPCSQPPIR